LGSSQQGHWLELRGHPSTMDAYHLQKVLLGEGKFGKVHRAVRHADGQYVAVKRLAKSAVTDRGQLEAEARLQMDLSQPGHPNILKLVGACLDDECFNLVLEYAGDGDLGDKIMESKSGIAEPQASSACKQVLEAVAYLDQRNILHRDIKPDNFFLQSTCLQRPGSLKLGDFGLATRGPTSAEQCGTIAFRSPEHYRGGPYGTGNDAWAAGVTIHMVRTGRFPFLDPRGAFSEAMLLSGCCCSQTCGRLLRPDPNERSSAAEVARSLALVSDAPTASHDVLMDALAPNANHPPDMLMDTDAPAPMPSNPNDTVTDTNVQPTRCGHEATAAPAAATPLGHDVPNMTDSRLGIKASVALLELPVRIRNVADPKLRGLHLNGQTGVIIGFDRKHGRANVQLLDGTTRTFTSKQMEIIAKDPVQGPAPAALRCSHCTEWKRRCEKAEESLEKRRRKH